MASENQSLPVILPKITPIQAKFVELYLSNPNLQWCADQLGSALRTVYTWRQKKNVQRHLQHYRAKTVEKCAYTQDQVTNEAGRIAFQDIKRSIPSLKYDNDTGEAYVKAEDWDLIDGRLIKSVKQDVKDGVSVIKLEFWDKIAALRLLQDHFKGIDPNKSIHVHLTADDLAERDIHGSAKVYEEMMKS